MRTLSRAGESMVARLKREQLRNNVQKVLLTLLMTSTKDGWVARTAFRIPSVGSRLRDLRKMEFGGFAVECQRASALRQTGRRVKPSVVTTQQTYYRISPTSVTVAALKQALKGVV